MKKNVTICVVVAILFGCFVTAWIVYKNVLWAELSAVAMILILFFTNINVDNIPEDDDFFNP